MPGGASARRPRPPAEGRPRRSGQPAWLVTFSPYRAIGIDDPDYLYFVNAWSRREGRTLIPGRPDLAFCPVYPAMLSACLRAAAAGGRPSPVQRHYDA